MDTVSPDSRIYQDLILERARAPRHGSGLDPFDAQADGNNPMCGDRLTVQVRRGEADTIEAVGFQARGCAITIASADLMAEAVSGLTADEARALASAFEAMVQTGEVPDDPRFTRLAALAGVHAFRSRIRCATLPWSALGDAMGQGSGR